MCIVQEMAQQAPDEVAALDAAVRAATSHLLVSNMANALADGIPAAHKMTQEAINEDEVVDFGSSPEGCHLGKSIIVSNAVSRQCERAMPSVPFAPLAQRKARPKERCL